MKLINEFLGAWKTFEASTTENGWQVIPVTSFLNCRLLAGMAFPRLSEAAIFNFEIATLPRAELLPSGKGFSVEPVDIEGKRWLALTRSQDGKLDLYVAMLENLFELIEELSTVKGDILLHSFLDRVSAWQDFMKKGRQNLTIESQTGLFGELSFLKDLLGLGLKEGAIKTWDGPLNGLQDFHIGFGAIEVKSTISQDGFIAKIGSLDQLSDSTYKPLYLVGKRLALSPNGTTLPMLIDEIRIALAGDLSLLSNFESRLLRSGYLDTHSGAYDRFLVVEKSLMYEVDEDFPRLTPQLVNPLVKSARYEIDISSLPAKSLDIMEILNKLGVSI
ncbi:PD-(D/E)XK motif protein [Polynucleobacter rarus]|uniref:PD-(D/E)XK motif protein n=1 Tax=Polynucleobacter rarus TaxID=556055 RepID=UPI00131ED4AD|nr:PD-(D/E)XK motif protein [Polynucleobacter rarus]